MIIIVQLAAEVNAKIPQKLHIAAIHSVFSAKSRYNKPTKEI